MLLRLETNNVTALKIRRKQHTPLWADSGDSVTNVTRHKGQRYTGYLQRQYLVAADLIVRLDAHFVGAAVCTMPYRDGFRIQ